MVQLEHRVLRVNKGSVDSQGQRDVLENVVLPDILDLSVCTLNTKRKTIPFRSQLSLLFSVGRKMSNGVFTRSSKLPANVFKIHVLMLDACWIV